MFMKLDGSLNFATSLTAAAPAARVATPTRPSPSARQPGGIALLDGPNLMCCLVRLAGAPAIGPGKLDLARLRAGLRQRAGMGIAQFEFVMPRHPCHSRAVLRQTVCDQGWNYVQIARPRYGWDEHDPVDDHIRELIARKARNSKPGTTIALVAHDGGYAPVLEHALDEGMRLIVVGLLSLMSHKIKRLRCRQMLLVDLREFGLVLPESKRPVVASLAHQSPGGGSLATSL